jgi:hypothetical protein
MTVALARSSIGQCCSSCAMRVFSGSTATLTRKTPSRVMVLAASSATPHGHFLRRKHFFALVSELAKRLVSGRGCGCVVILPGSVRFRA